MTIKIPMDRYRVKLTLLRNLLATNPIDPNVLDTHIIDRQRKLIMEKSKVNAEVNKYLDALAISPERGAAESALILERLEQLVGRPLEPDEQALVIAGKLDDLRETFHDLDMKGTTVFFWNKELNRPMIGDHMIYGFMKAAAEAIGRTDKYKKERKAGVPLYSISYTQSLINQHVRCDQEFLTFDNDVKRMTNGDSAFDQRSLRAKTAQGDRIALVKSEVIPTGSAIEFNLGILEGSPLNETIVRTLFSYGEIVGLGQWRSSGRGSFMAEIEKVIPLG